MTTLTDEQYERFSRHIQLQDIGVEGQKKLLDARVLIIGVGGLGSPVSLYLAAAGVGTLGVADSDVVDISNLQRQICHSTNDVSRPKVLSAKEKMQAINPDLHVITYEEYVGGDSIRALVREYDFVVDGADNFATKFLINDACVLEKVPFSHGGVLRFDGQTMTVIPGDSACYRCVFKNPPPGEAAMTCSQAGIMGAVAGMLGTIQAAEVVKWITGVGELLLNRLLTFDALSMRFREIELAPQPSCGVCGEKPSITKLTL